MRALTSLALMTAAGVMLGAAPVAGQEGTTSTGFQPYLFAAPGGISSGGTTLHVGGGVDLVLWKGLGASVEGGYVGPMEAMDYGLGIISTKCVLPVRDAEAAAHHSIRDRRIYARVPQRDGERDEHRGRC